MAVSSGFASSITGPYVYFNPAPMRRFPPRKIYKLYNNLFSKSASLVESCLVQR